MMKHWIGSILRIRFCGKNKSKPTLLKEQNKHIIGLSWNLVMIMN